MVLLWLFLVLVLTPAHALSPLQLFEGAIWRWDIVERESGTFISSNTRVVETWTLTLHSQKEELWTATLLQESTQGDRTTQELTLRQAEGQVWLVDGDTEIPALSYQTPPGILSMETSAAGPDDPPDGAVLLPADLPLEAAPPPLDGTRAWRLGVLPDGPFSLRLTWPSGEGWDLDVPLG